MSFFLEIKRLLLFLSRYKKTINDIKTQLDAAIPLVNSKTNKVCSIQENIFFFYFIFDFKFNIRSDAKSLHILRILLRRPLQLRQLLLML
jgi:hypothetical protein